MVRGWTWMLARRVALLGPTPVFGGITQSGLHGNGRLWMGTLGTSPSTAPHLFLESMGQNALARRRMPRRLAPWMAVSIVHPKSKSLP